MRNSEKQYPYTYSSPLIKGVRGLLRNIANLKPGDHLCCLYETEEEHRALLTPFLRQGLERGEKVLYIVDARTAETVLDYLRDDGLDVEPYLASGQLGILAVDDAYMRNGVFDPDGMIALLRSETERALVEGYAALRVTSEMTWALRGLPGSERLIEYESRLNTFFPGSKCLAICQYDRRAFDPALLLDVLATHPSAVVGTAIYDNFYYMPPEDFLSDNRSEATLRNWLKNLAERNRAEEKLRESEKKFKNLVEITSDWIWECDKEGLYTYVSPKVKSLLGYEVSEVLGKSAFDLMPKEEEVKIGKFFKEKVAKKEPFYGLENVCRHKDGHLVTIETSAVPIFNDEGKFQGYRGIDRDITERKQAEERIKASLEEKEALLREVHHRVKNNMQVISSLLSLQERKIKDERYSEMLKESQNRIKSMSLVHEKLYQSVNLADIDFGDYIKNLANSLFQSYGTKGKIALKVDCEDVHKVHQRQRLMVRLPIDSAIPCGLILNELISNSLKHAFPEGKEGEINISLRSPGDKIELVVSDNGVGIPEGLDFRNTESLGLHLVTILAEGQLHGKIELERTAGTSFRIRFDKKGSAGFRK